MSAFTNFFSKIGHGLNRGFGQIGHGFSQGFNAIGKPLAGIASTFAPMAGTALGGFLGGPMGAMLGNTLGGAAGNLFGSFSGGGGGGEQQQMPSFQDFGQGFGEQAGNYLNQMLPPQYQGMNIGQLGQSFSANMGNRMNSMLPQGLQGYGLGQRAGSFLNNQFGSRIPSSFQNQTLGGMGRMFGGQGGRYMGGYMANNAMPMMQGLRSRFGFAQGGGVHGLRDMADLLGHPYPEGGEVYS